ncbi:MAG TPA: oligosaccharide flippase family protein [Saprospiraceae bacterium]|nr:oligosaccharide flippase family protein [Saprospiraceae bacterium]
MGVVARQSIKASIVNYIGLGVSLLSTLFIFPLDLKLYGLYGFIISTSIILTALSSFGSGGVAVRYFPKYQDAENGHGGLLKLSLLINCLGWVIFTALFFLFYPAIKQYTLQKNQDALPYLTYIIPLVFAISLYGLFNNYLMNFHRVAMPSAITNSLKIALPLLFLLCYFHTITIHQFFLLLCLFSFGQLLLIVLYTYQQGQLFLRRPILALTDQQYKSMLVYSFLSVFGGLASVIALQFDSIMVANLLGLEANGKYMLAVFMAASCYIPATMILTAMLPVISKHLNDNNLIELNKAYKNVSVAVLIPTLFLASGLFICFVPLRDLMVNSEKLNGVATALVFLMFARIVDGATSINGYILSFSTYYKYDLVFLILLSVSNVYLNSKLIPLLNISGAAIATFISVCLYNFAKSVFIYKKFNLHPLTSSLFILIALSLILSAALFYIPRTSFPVLDILIRGVLFSSIYLSGCYYLNISKEYNQLLDHIFSMLKTKVLRFK